MPYKFKRNRQVIGKIEAPQRSLQSITNDSEKYTNSQKADNDSTSWSRNSTASDSWSEELEDVATQKILEEWDNIENFIYDEKSTTINELLLEECTQWKSQVPHLRVLGEQVLSRQDVKDCDDKGYIDFPSQKTDDLSRRQRLKKVKTQVVDIIFKYVTSKLNSNSEDATDSLNDKIDEIVKITPTPLHDNKNRVDKHLKPFNKEKYSNHKVTGDFNIENQLSESNSVLSKKNNEKRASSCKKNPKDRINHDPVEKRLHTTPSARNKRGTIFNERMIVSPVPYVVSTRESFCTLKTTSVRFMGEAVEYSVPPRHRNNTLQVYNTSKNKIGSLKSQDFLTGWEPPVYPTVWPKNVKLAPIDVTRLHSSKKRSSGLSATITPRGRKALSPISHIILPSISHNKCNTDEKQLEIHGKHIFGQSKSNVFSINYENSCKKSHSLKQSNTKKY